MFRKRPKKVFPAGTFIALPARICAIIQLCLAFVVILWNASQPFMGELFSYKSQMLLYQDVMGLSKPADTVERSARLARNQQRFEALPRAQRAELIAQYDQLQQLSQRSLVQKLKRALHILVFEIPFYEQLWLILSIILPILLLKRVEGANQAIWILPLLTTIYAFDNQWFAKTPFPSAEEKLFPSEQLLINEYLNKPLSANLLEQKEQLLAAWKNYVLQVWTPPNLISKAKTQAEAFEEGEFIFNLARIKALLPPRLLLTANHHQTKERLPLLSLYLFWNFFFALTVLRSQTCDSSHKQMV